MNIANLKEALAALADERSQRRAWVDNEQFFPDVTELTCQLFDDTGLESLRILGTMSEHVGHEAAIAIEELSAAMNELDVNIAPAQLFASPEMRKVRRLAHSALQALTTTGTGERT